MFSHVSRLGLLIVVLIPALIFVLLVDFGDSARAQVQFGFFQEFEEPERPFKVEMNREFRPILNEYQAEMARRQEQGDVITCSVQIFREAHWMVNYTTYRDRVEQRIADLDKSLEEKDQSWAAEQTKGDGSWGACYEAWFFRLLASVEALREMQVRGERPRHPLKFLEPVNTPEKLTKAFESVLVSRMETEGRSYRREMNNLATAMGQLLLRPGMDEVLDPDFPREALAEAMIRFMDDTWQNPDTGYWGEWYENKDGEIVKTDDLSFTFHIVSYRHGKVPRLRQIVDTTFNLRERPYPFGWQDRGTKNNHHMYDVVRLLRYGWPHMTDLQQARAQAEIFIMLARSLRLTIDGQGKFYTDAYDNVGDAFYFGVSFLDEVGYFWPTERPWFGAKRTYPGAERLRLLLMKHLQALDQRDPMVLSAIRKLDGLE